MPSPDSSNPAPRKVTPLWRNLNFTLMWSSVAASGFGDRLITFASLVLLGSFAAEGEGVRVSFNAGTQFWFFLPYLLFSMAFGWLADHVPRKWIMLGCDETRAMILFVAFLMLGALWGSPPIPAEYHWRIYAILFLIGTMAAAFNPARNATIPEIVELQQLPSANAVLLGLGVVASMVGALVAPQIIDVADGSTIRRGILFALAFYGISGTFFAFLRVRRQHRAAPQSKRSILQAARYIGKHKRIISLIAMDTLVWSAAMVVYNGALALGDQHFALTGDALFQHFAVMTAMIGLGMLAGAGVIALVQTRREATTVLGIGIVGAGLSIVAFATIPYRGVHFASAFMIGVFGNVAIVNVIALVQSLTPNYMRGRVMGVANIVSTIGTVSVNLLLWRMPSVDLWIVIFLYVIGPVMILIGLWTIVAHLTAGPHTDRGTNLFWRLDRLYVFSWHRLRSRGKENIPSDGPVIIASNHTTGLDPLLLQAPCRRVVRWLMFKHYEFALAAPLWRRIKPISMTKGAGRTAQVRQVVQALEGGECVGLFPEGGIQRKERELKPFQPGIVMIASRANATIVPAWIEGTPRRKNMLWHFVQPTRSTVHFGEPFRFDPEATPAEALADLRRRMLALAGQFEDRGGS